MEREHRYYVAKIKDVEKYLSDEHQLQFDRLLTKIRIGRLNDGKADVQTVCVDSDWPEYETVWRMIEARVDGKASPASAQEGWKHSCNALCVDGVELWIPQCPHCGKPAPTPPVSEDRKDAENSALKLAKTKLSWITKRANYLDVLDIAREANEAIAAIDALGEAI